MATLTSASERSLLDVAAVAGYVVALLALGYWTRRNRTFTEFAVGRRSLPPIMIFASLAATVVGPGFSVGFTAKGFQSGYLFFLLAVPYALQMIFTGVLLAPRLARQKDCVTIGDVMRKSYGRLGQCLAGLVSLGLLLGFTAIMGKVGGSMLQAVTGWPLWTCVTALTGATALLTFAGGVRATVATEGFQFIVFSVIIPVLLLVAIWNSPMSLQQHSAQAWQLAESTAHSMSGWTLCGIALSFLLGEMLLPPYANRALAAKSPNASAAGFVMAGFYVVVWLGLVVALGVVSRCVLPNSGDPDQALMTMGSLYLPMGLYGVLIASVIAIVMSSQEAVLNSGAVSFVRDVIGSIARPSDKAALMLARSGTLAMACGAIVLAQFSPSIIDGLLMLYAIWAPTIIIPLVGALWGWKGTPASGLLSMLLGGGTSFAWQALLGEPFGIPAIVIGLTASAIGFVAGRWIGTCTCPTIGGVSA